LVVSYICCILAVQLKDMKNTLKSPYKKGDTVVWLSTRFIVEDIIEKSQVDTITTTRFDSYLKLKGVASYVKIEQVKEAR